MNFHTCRFCHSSDNVHGLEPIHYSVRHWAHPDCLLKAKGAGAWSLLHDWQLESFPALAAFRNDLYDSLGEAIRSRKEHTS